MRRVISFVLTTLFLLDPLLAARAAAESEVQPQETAPQKPGLKEKLIAIAPQTFVEVRFRDKSKLRGRLGEINNEGFALQVAQGNEIQNMSVSFDQVKSVKALEKKGTSAGKIVAYSLAGVGAFFTTLLVVCLAGACGG